MNPLDEIVLQELQAYFPLEQVDVRVGPTYGNPAEGGKPLYYIPARRVQQRLDNVVGPMGWQVDFSKPVNREKGGSTAGAEATISIRDPFTGEWVSKSDVSQNTAQEGMKGGYSKSIVRAGVQWGIGRYLYFLPESPWLDVEEKYGNTKFKDDPMNAFPKQYTPQGSNSGSDFTADEVRQLRNAVPEGVSRDEVSEAWDPSLEFSELLDLIRNL